MMRWQTGVGAVIGLGVGAGILAVTGGGAGPATSVSGPILSECDGHVRELVIHYEPSAGDIVGAVYRDFLGALESDVTVEVVCPSRAAFEELRSGVGRVRCRLAPVVVSHPITTWSRDRWVALAPARPGLPATVLSPRGEAAEEIWPARAGDEQVGSDLAAARAPWLRARRSELYFDGGDFLADSDNVFVAPRVLQRNLQHTVRSGDELLRVLAVNLKRRVILLEAAPDHHVAMFMVSAGGRRLVVGDPSLAVEFASAAAQANGAAATVLASLPGGADFTAETQHRFDAVASQGAAAGYTVVRIPAVPARDGRTYLTYTNVLIDEQGQRRVVYVPFYSGMEPLNRAARVLWERLGCQVRPVDCTGVYGHFGCLHCLVNVLARVPR